MFVNFEPAGLTFFNVHL